MVAMVCYGSSSLDDATHDNSILDEIRHIDSRIDKPNK